jgi:hypothetical protein
VNIYLPVISTEYIYLPDVKAFDQTNGDAVDPTRFNVQWAFVAPGTEPVDTDWYPGSWSPGTANVIRCLVGPNGGKVLAKGDYDVWADIVGANENPKRRVGSLTIG